MWGGKGCLDIGNKSKWFLFGRIKEILPHVERDQSVVSDLRMSDEVKME